MSNNETLAETLFRLLETGRQSTATEQHVADDGHGPAAEFARFVADQLNN